ncbi:DNA gyrase inhibitor YacG [uncultured Sulfitobacter sp.]|uniref:DNA gyrase inhibitor YacG n=1 Tax=uncultured Sulfitobacter sp. TaxID=191468 RepID=UPI002602CF6C|nr:DNA gyrase inhibitor YacG [uncultured Sulfitobacter sp.]
MSCPICDRKTAPDYRPFCSRRCADVDLAKWLNGAYAVPSNDPEDVEKVIDALDTRKDEDKH